MNNTDCPRNGLAKLSIFLQFFAVGSRPTGQQINFNLLGSFFAQSDKFNVIPSFNFSKSNFAQKKLRTYVLLECIRALQNPKGFKLHLQKLPLTYVLGNHGQLKLDKIFYSTATCQIITILCPWVLRPRYAQ